MLFIVGKEIYIMKKGISIWSFAESSLEKCFQLAKDAGYDGVEIALDETGEVNLTSTKEDILKIKACAEKVGIQLYSVASGLYGKYNYTSPDEEKREKAKAITRKQLEVASWLGCDTILVVPGANEAIFDSESENVEFEVAYERALCALKELAPYAEKLKVSIGLENVLIKFLLSPLAMVQFIDEVGSPFVGSYFDVGNVWHIGHQEQWIRTLGFRIKKVHFKDYRKLAGGLHIFVDLLAGDVNYPAVMDAFTEIGYDDWCTAEMFPPYTHYPETILYNTSNAMDKILRRNTAKSEK